MKLIDILVEELPKRDGWPEKASHAVYAKRFSRVCFTVGGAPAITGDDVSIFEDDGAGHGVFWLPGALLDCEEPIDYATAIITREQYEAALAEKEHPLPWDEKNKPCPTLGAECRGCPDCGRRVSCTSDDITDDAVRAEMGMNSRDLDAALAAKNDGWIEWGGGDCPVDGREMVDVIFGHGGIMSTNIADCWCWSHDGTNSDIIAYRLHKPQEAERVNPDDEADLNECIGQDAAPVWNGEGLPPVGCECEVSVDGGRSWCAYKAINEKNGARLIEIGNFTEEFQNNNWIFRPIRTEEDKKREAAIKELTSVICGEIPDTGMATAAMYAARVYDAGYRK